MVKQNKMHEHTQISISRTFINTDNQKEMEDAWSRIWEMTPMFWNLWRFTLKNNLPEDSEERQELQHIPQKVIYN